ncbi:MAG: rhodanese-like domain-containing protein [Bryobacteraceae bacterium]
MRGKLFTWTLNLICIVCAAIVVWQFAERFRGADAGNVNPITVGSKVELPQVRWSDSPKTVVLAVSTYCQYCTTSAPFYRALIQESARGGFRVVAAVRETEVDARPLLASLGLEHLGDIRHGDLETIGVRVTPTVLIVDREGSVEAVWSGKLKPSEQRDVFARLGSSGPASAEAARPAAASTPQQDAMKMATGARLRELLASSGTTLVDVRERAVFEKGHVDGALNIPLDEILSRAPHELPREETVLLYCRSESKCAAGPDASSRQAIEMPLCRTASVAFGWAGFHKLDYVNEDLGSLAALGVKVKGDTCR